MIKFIKDGYNVIDEEFENTFYIKDAEIMYFYINKDVQIYIQKCLDAEDNIIFMMFKNGGIKVPYKDETIYSMCQIGLTPDMKFKDVIERFKRNYNFDENWFCRIYENPSDYMLTLQSNAGNTNSIQFAKNELKILLNKTAKEFKNENELTEEQLKETLRQQEDLSENIIDILQLLTAQMHNETSYEFVNRMTNMLVHGVPITEITEDDEWEEAPVPSNNDNNNKYYVNKRCELISKLIKEDGSIKYEYIRARLYKNNKDGKLYYNPELSPEEITLPWFYKPTEIVEVDMPDNPEDDKFYCITDQ